MARIVVLEDEAVLREELAAFLGKRGHTIKEAGALADFWPLMAGVDIALIDLMLPDGDGFSAVTRLRETCPAVGVIMLTARSGLQDTLQGLASGADHYLIKPFRLLELAAIIETLLRRMGAGWRLSLPAHRLTSPDGFCMALTASEMTLLKLLTTVPPGGFIDRRSVVEALGQNWLDYDLRRLDTLVSRLRHRWLEETGQCLPLRTEHRKGYSFGVALQLMV
jgi:two-component system, OmpR family, response regulator